MALQQGAQFRKSRQPAIVRANQAGASEMKGVHVLAADDNLRREVGYPADVREQAAQAQLVRQQPQVLVKQWQGRILIEQRR